MRIRNPLTRPKWLPSSSLRGLIRDEAGLLIGLLIVALLVLGFVLLAGEVLEGDMAGFDNRILMSLRSAGNPATAIGPPWFEEMARDLTALGSSVFIGLLAVVVVGFFVLVRKPGAAKLMAVAVIGGAIVSSVLKTAFDRPRPEIPQCFPVFTASFPSGHATLSAVTYLTIGILLARLARQRRLKVYFVAIAMLLTILVGLSRVYLGVHYPSDVLAGWSIGSAWAILCWAIAIRQQRRGAIEPPGFDDRAEHP